MQQLEPDGRLVRRFELECSPRYFAQKPGEAGWIDVSCGERIVSLEIGPGRVQLSRTREGEPALPGLAGLVYAPDGTLYAYTADAVIAYGVEHASSGRGSRRP